MSLRMPFAAAVAVTTIVCGGGLARAQEAASNRYRSEKNFAMELRLGPYRPDIDGEFTDKPPEERPHARYFGNKRRLLVQAELDYQVFKSFGSLAVGLSIGYTKENAKAFVETGPGTDPMVRAGDTTSLMLMPTALSLVYRFDVLAVRYNVPLVPYVKGGLDWIYWSISDGDGSIAKDQDGMSGRGGTTGYHGAVGLALMLDIFDPGAAQEFDAETGVNHTYIFGEFRHSEVNGLTGRNALHLGDTTWSAGLMFEF